MGTRELFRLLSESYLNQAFQSMLYQHCLQLWFRWPDWKRDHTMEGIWPYSLCFPCKVPVHYSKQSSQ